MREPTVKAAATLGLTLVLLGLASLAWADEPRAFALPTDNTSFEAFGVHIVLKFSRLCRSNRRDPAKEAAALFAGE